MRKDFLKIFLLLLAGLVLGVFLFGAWQGVAAQTTDFGLEALDDTIALGSQDIRLTIAKIIRAVLGLLGIIALVIMMYGGYVYMTAGGDEQKVSTAKKILINSVIGLVIILSALAITQFIFSKLSEATGFGTEEEVSANCLDLAYAAAHPAECSGGGFDSCLANVFVVKSITPNMVGGADIAMNNFAVRVILSDGLAPSIPAEDTFTIIRDGTDISGNFIYSFIDSPKNSVIEAASLAAPLGTFASGNYSIAVSDTLISASDSELETDNACGAFPREATYSVSTSGILDKTKPTVDDITYNGTAYGGTIALPRGGAYSIGSSITDNSGAGYAHLQIQRRSSTDSVALGAPVVVYDGPLVGRGSQATLVDPYEFNYDLFISKINPLFNEAANPTYYEVVLTVADIDHNNTVVNSSFIVVDSSCSFGSGAGASPGCRGGGACVADADCVSGVCDESAGICVNTPIITEINPAEAAGGNWVTILGQYFGATTGRILFNGVPAVLAACAGADVWNDSYIIAEVPPDNVALPEGGGIVVTVEHQLYASDPASYPDFFDTTNNDRGVIKDFTKNNSINRPGLCALVPPAGLPRDDVSALGNNLGTSGQLTFGGIQAPITLWHADGIQIDARVPDNMNPGLVGVLATVDGVAGNGIPFRIMSEEELVAPVVESISPPDVTRESYITILGQRFGDSVGTVYLCDDTDMEDISDCTTLSTSLPSACGVTWSNTQIIAEIPLTAPIASRFLVVENSLSGLQSIPSDTDRLNVITGPPMPSICSLIPVSGSAPLSDGHPGLSIKGINFSAVPNVYFWGRGSSITDNSTWLSLSASTVFEGVLQTILTPIPVDYAGHAVPSEPIVNNDGFSMHTGPIKLQSATGQESNSINYSVTDCRNLTDIPAGMYCCTEGEAQGNLIDDSFACPGEARSGAYVWRFTTGRIPGIPRVLEKCEDASLTFSPTPWSTHNDGDKVCLNRNISVDFTMAMDPTSFAGNVLLYTCGTGDAPESCTELSPSEFSNVYFGDTLTIRAATPAPAGFGDLAPDTWYHVELLEGIRGVEWVDVLGVPTEFNPLLQKTRPCGTGTAFCFDFKTGPAGTQCRLTGAQVKPPTYSTDKLGLVLNRRYPIEDSIPIYYQIFGRGEQACSFVPVDIYDWTWDTDLPAFATVNSPVLSKDELANATALSQPPSGPVKVQTSAMVTGALVSSYSDLYINLAPPHITDYWPNCSEACVNATIGAVFSVDMNPAKYTSGIHIYECPDENTCINIAAAFDEEAPVTPALPPKTFSVLDPDRRDSVTILPDVSLSENTSYLVYFDNSIMSVGEVDLLGVIVRDGLPLQPKMWIFKTKPDGTFCAADRIAVVPDPFTAYFIGQKKKYSVFPYTDADQCSPLGQQLNPWGFGWQWSSADTDVAEITNFSTAGKIKQNCGLGCLPSGSDISAGSSLVLCGNGVVEPGEDCDVAAVGEIPEVSCGLNCLRPGSSASNCGNGVVEPHLGEECDKADSATMVQCSDICTHLGSTADSAEAAEGLPLCGSGAVTVGEDCEPGLGGEIAGSTCANNCLHVGTKLSQEWCDDNPFYASNVQCQSALSVCGNDLLESGEECEAGGPFYVFDGTDNGIEYFGISETSCSSKCLLQNICAYPYLSPFYCDPATQEGCNADCTLGGSSVDKYGAPSLCGDGVVGIGEYAWCEYSSAELSAFAIPGENPVQAATAIGAAAVDAITQNQNTQIESILKRVRGAAADLPPEQRLDYQADYTLACGFREFDAPAAVPFNDCRDNLYNTKGVGANSCCYLRPQRIDEYPHDGAGIIDGETACLNSFISATFDGDIAESDIYRNIILARGYTEAEIGLSSFVDEQWLSATIADDQSSGLISGKFGNAYNFDGIDDYIELKPGVAPWGNDATISAWVNSPSLDTSDGKVIIVNVAGSTWSDFTAQGIGIVEGKLIFVVLENDSVGCGRDNAFHQGTITISNNTWHHIATTIDQSANIVKLYVDGVFDSEVNIADLNDSGCGIQPLDTVGAIFLPPELSDSLYADIMIDELKVVNTVLTPAEIVLEASGAGDIYFCQSLGMNNVTDLVNNTLAYNETSVPEVGDGFWRNLWQGIKRFFVWILGIDAKASLTDVAGIKKWCDTNLVKGLPKVVKTKDSAGKVVESDLNLYINELLDPNSVYAVLLRGGKNGIKDARGVGIRNPDYFSKINDSWLFRTGDEVCKVASVNVAPPSYFYSTPKQEQNFSATVAATSGGLIAPIAGVYNWDWNWTPAASALFSISPVPSVVPDVTIAATELTGKETVGAHATITEDADTLNNQVGLVFSGTANLTSLFCENPWPPKEIYPYEEGISFGASPYVNNDGTDTAGVFDGSALSTVFGEYFNFKMGYCADDGLSGVKGDDLPYLKPFVFTESLPDPDNLKRFLFFNDLNDDAVGIQVFKTAPAANILDKESLYDWFVRHHGLPVGYRNISIDGYDAMTNGSNYYISAINRPDSGALYNNIYLFSINEGAQENTRKVFEQLIDSLEFNINMSDNRVCEGAPGIACFTDFDCRDNKGIPIGLSTGICQADKTKMRRDWGRLSTIRNSQIKINSYVSSTAQAPQLASGTYIPGKTRSTWPSWGTLSAQVGGVGLDPVNRWSACNYCQVPGGSLESPEQLCSSDDDCAGAGEICVTIDNQTCWDELNSRFICPAYANVLGYRTDAITDYKLSAQLEFFTISDIDKFVDTEHFVLETLCAPGAVESAEAGSCGNGVINAGESCDPPGQKRNTAGGCLIEGVPGLKVETCSASCQWQQSCQASNKCGNGKVEEAEVCDSGVLNGTHGYCNSTCSGFGGRYCGDGAIDKYCSYTGNYCSGGASVCVTSCAGDSTCLALNVCAQTEYCDRGAANGDYLTPSGVIPAIGTSCSSNCLSFGPRCGDGVLHTSLTTPGASEECDDGNNINNDGCGFDCKVEAVIIPPVPVFDPANCGNGTIDAGEVCDRGAAANGVKCTPGYDEKCNYCAFDCQKVLFVEPIAYCGNGEIDQIAFGPPPVNEACEYIPETCPGGVCSGPFILTPTKLISEDACKEDSSYNFGTKMYTAYSGIYQCENKCTTLANNCALCGHLALASGGVNPRVSIINPMITSFISSNYAVRASDLDDPDNFFIRFYFKKWNESIEDFQITADGSTTVKHVTSSTFIVPTGGSIVKPENIFIDNETGENRYGVAPDRGLVSSLACSGQYYLCFSPDLTSTPDSFGYKCLSNDLDSEYLWDYKVKGESYNIDNEYVVSPALPAGSLRLVLRWTGAEQSKIGSGGYFGLGILNEIYGTNTYSVNKISATTCTKIEQNIADYWIPDNTCNTNKWPKAGDWPDYSGSQEGVFTHGKSNASDISTQAMTINIPDGGTLVNNGPYPVFVEAQGPGGGAPMMDFSNSKLSVEIYEYKDIPPAGSAGTTLFKPAGTISIKTAQKSSNPEAKYWHVLNIVKDLNDGDGSDTDGDGTQEDYVISYVNKIVTRSNDILEGAVILPVTDYCGDGIDSAKEVCDGSAGKYYKGSKEIFCLSDCTGFEAYCGDGVVHDGVPAGETNLGEQCDPPCDVLSLSKGWCGPVECTPQCKLPSPPLPSI